MTAPVETARRERFVRAAAMADLGRAGCLPVQLEGHTVALFFHGGQVYAVDNRCPHMGFPLHRGTADDGVLTCHWHHARFDLSSGGTFDQWADDVRTYPVKVEDGDVWVDLAPIDGSIRQQKERVVHGLERNIPLVLAKAAIGLGENAADPREAFRIGLEFGTRYRQAGWGQGLTMLACMMDLMPWLDVEQRQLALYHGLAAVARDSADAAPRFIVQPLPGSAADPVTLKRWFRRFVEVRDSDGAERCLVSAVRADANHRQVADMLFAAATDHRYLQGGHVLDFTNKALEALDRAGWDLAEPVLASLANVYATADRMEESSAWRYPIDLVAILDRAFDALPHALGEGERRHGSWTGRDALVSTLFGDDPQAIAHALVEALRDGARPAELGGVVAYAAALRIARFHTSNEFGDWDTALHTFTFANAVHQALGRSDGREPLRGVFDAAMSVYLDRYLNMPPAPLPAVDPHAGEPDGLLDALPRLLDRQQQVDESAALVSQYLAAGGGPAALLGVIGGLLLREDRDFHTIQVVEAGFRQYSLLGDGPSGRHVVVAVTRYLAAHAPTLRAQRQTFNIARRLSRGERLDEE
jgi:nitrite reductase/ring-hydroxylating ferredoxin subunit